MEEEEDKKEEGKSASTSASGGDTTACLDDLNGFCDLKNSQQGWHPDTEAA
jgi:hypothetical protein